MSPIKVIAIDDDCHPICFRTYGSAYSAAEMMTKMAKPHTIAYEIRMFTYIDYDEDSQEAMDCNLLFSTNKPERLLIDKGVEALEEYIEAFDRLWRVANPNELYI